MKLSDKILNVAAELGPEKKKLEDLTKKLEDVTKRAAESEDADQEEALLAESEELSKQVDELAPIVEKLEKRLAELRKAEQRLAGGGTPVGDGESRQGPALLKAGNRNHKPGQSLVRLGVVRALAHMRRMPDAQVAEELYPDDDHFKAVFHHLTKTAAPSANTVSTGYAAELVETDVRGLLEEIEAVSVAAALALWASRSGGMMLNFGGNASITVPRLNPTGASPTEPAWVQEGGAIPVGSLSLGSAVINRYKLAEILVTTMELREQAVVNVEDMFRRAMQRAYTRVLDTALISNLAAVPAVRPAGLLNGITVTAGDATGGTDSVRIDISDMLDELLTANQDAVPVLLLNNRNRANLSFLTNALGEYIYASDVAAGRLLNMPVVASANVPNGTAIMVDASSLAMALDAPMFDISQVATVVMANADTTAPTMADNPAGAVGTAGQVRHGIDVVPSAAIAGGAGAGYTAKSMFQTLTVSLASFCGNAVAKLRELLGTPSWTISSQAA